MKIAQYVGLIPGFKTQTQKIGDTQVVSITGPAKAIGYGLQFALLVGILTIDQIMRFGIRKDGQKAHLVLAEDTKYAFTKAQENKLALLPGYHYAHQVTAMDQGVNVAIFDEGFTPDEKTGKAFGQFAAAIFEKGRVRGSDTNTMILLGRSAQNRVLVSSQWGKQNPLTLVDQEITGDVRYATSKDDTLIAAEYGTGRIAALHVSELVEMFQNGTVPSWQKQLVAGTEIEDITPSIGNQATVVLTATINGQRKLVPANVGWTEKKDDAPAKFSFALVQSYATDMPKDKGPVVRLSQSTITLVDSNGRDTARLAIEDIGDFGSKATVTALRRMAQDAASGAVYAAAA